MSIAVARKDDRKANVQSPFIHNPVGEIGFQSLRRLSRIALTESDTEENGLPGNFRKKIKDFLVRAYIRGFSRAYPYYGNEFVVKILEKIGENMAPVFMQRMAYSDEPLARGIYNMTLRYANQRTRLRRNIGHTLYTIVLNPTNRCNRSCKECYIGSGLVGKDDSFRPRDMNPDQMSAIVEQVKSFYGTTFLTWTGGEPTLKWKDIIRVLERHPDVYGILFTNNDIFGSSKKVDGRYLGEKVLDEFRRVGNVAIGNSFEGSPEYTDAIRGGKAFDNAKRAMEWERQRDLFFGPSLTPTNENVDYITSEEFRKLVRDELGVSFLYYFACMPIGPDTARTRRNLVSPENRLKLVKTKSKWIMQGDNVLYMDFWNDGALIQGCMAGGQNYLNFTPPHLPKEQIDEHVKPYGYSEKDVVTAILPCVFFQGIAGYFMEDGKVVGKGGLWESIPQFVENDPSLKGFRDGFQQEIRDRMADGEHWLGCAPCVFYDHPETGLSRYENSFFAMQPTFTIHAELKSFMADFSRKWRDFIRHEYVDMVDELNQEYDMGLDDYVAQQKELTEKMDRRERGMN